MTIKDLYNYGRQKIAHESLILCEELYGFSRQKILTNPDTEIDNSDIFLDAIKRRLNGEPLQYVLGYWYFDDIRLTVKDGVLIPREDSLVLVDCAEKFIKNNNYKIVDLCSGTGAIALAIAKRCKNTQIEAVELFETAYNCLCENIDKHEKGRVVPKNLDIFSSQKLYNNLDVIVSNPPYIATKEISELDIEVQNEPHTALDGGADGLDFYRHICQNWKFALRKGGLLAVEIGETQGEEVYKLFEENGF
ncbi:MAG: peptide chain release factor N(5)-glutamine methyltransferase, partial [Clostridia bacterium]